MTKRPTGRFVVDGRNLRMQPAVGAPGRLRWTFSGALDPGAQLAVTCEIELGQ